MIELDTKKIMYKRALAIDNMLYSLFLEGILTREERWRYERRLRRWISKKGITYYHQQRIEDCMEWEDV